jgi:hypothetical protein
MCGMLGGGAYCVADTQAIGRDGLEDLPEARKGDAAQRVEEEQRLVVGGVHQLPPPLQHPQGLHTRLLSEANLNRGSGNLLHTRIWRGLGECGLKPMQASTTVVEAVRVYQAEQASKQHPNRHR